MASNYKGNGNRRRQDNNNRQVSGYTKQQGGGYNNQQQGNGNYNNRNQQVDDIQNLTYNLCHLFPRCNRAVSYPAPAYLAHHAATRGKVFIKNMGNFDNLEDLNRTIIGVKMNKAYKPKVTCIIVQKRNHTRFFPLEDGPSFGKMMNVFPGTVVDKVICHPKMKEFFLGSHESGFGTARPTKYIVIRD
uniref:Piwi domain-containing protein n=1 Tax=Megaselia scalaris TaxID=36166 RepID=T1GII4_MEGSC